LVSDKPLKYQPENEAEPSEKEQEKSWKDIRVFLKK